MVKEVYGIDAVLMINRICGRDFKLGRGASLGTLRRFRHKVKRIGFKACKSL
jgi:hypothetical protein